MHVLEENDNNWLVLTEDGTDTKSKSSPLNQLLYGYDLFGLLDRGDEILNLSGADEGPDVTIIPDEDARCYTLKIDRAGEDLHLGAQHKSELLDALVEVYEDHDGDNTMPLLRMFDRIRSKQIRDYVLEPFRDALPVEHREDGWFINGHLLLSWECDFFHPNTDSRKRSGPSVIATNNDRAYQMRLSGLESKIDREISIEGDTYRLSDKEMEFLAKAVWAVEVTPDRR